MKIKQLFIGLILVSAPLLTPVISQTETNGCAVAVTDDDTLAAESLLASTEGAFICPEGAACVAATQQLLRDGWLKPDERVVVLNTGCGIKYPETVQSDPAVLQPGDTLDIRSS